ncbi:MAG: 50S ribosomal protein L30 [Chloroflexota bacterium]
MADKKLRIKLVKSPIGYNKKQRRQAEILRLKKLNAVAVHYDTPVIRGMVYKIRHLVEVEEFEE